MQAAVDDQEGLAAGHLAIDDAAHVDAGLGDQVAAELEHQRRADLPRRLAGRAARVPRRSARGPAAVSPGK